MTRKKRRLYVWTNVFSDYTSGIALAIAASVEEARALVRLDYLGSPNIHNEHRVLETEEIEPDVYDMKDHLVITIAGGS